MLTAENLTTDYHKEGQVYKILDGLPYGFFTTFRLTYVARGLGFPGRSPKNQQDFAEACFRRKILPFVADIRELDSGATVSREYKITTPPSLISCPDIEAQVHNLLSQKYIPHEVVLIFNQDRLGGFNSERLALKNQRYWLFRGSLRFYPCLENGQWENNSNYGNLLAINRLLVPASGRSSEEPADPYEISLALGSLNGYEAKQKLIGWFNEQVQAPVR